MLAPDPSQHLEPEIPVPGNPLFTIQTYRFLLQGSGLSGSIAVRRTAGIGGAVQPMAAED
jgi:hypothetical protein